MVCEFGNKKLVKKLEERIIKVIAIVLFLPRVLSCGKMMGE